MQITVSILEACLCALMTYICLNRDLFYRVPFLSGRKPAEDENIPSPKLRAFLCAVAAISAFFSSMRLLAATHDLINILKLELGLLCLAGAGSVDLREHRIPNSFPLVCAGGGVILLVLGILTKQTGAISFVVSGAWAAAGTTVALLIARALTKNGIGLGDIKLLAALAILGGVNIICATLFFSMCACALASIFFLATKKKDLHSSLPFGPFIYVGFVITLLSKLF